MSTHAKTLIALVGIVVGVLAYEKTGYGTEIAVGVLLMSVMHLGIYYVESRRWKVKRGDVKASTEHNRFSIPLASGIFFIAVFLIILRMQFSVERDVYVCEKPCTFDATIISTPKIKNEYQLFVVSPDVEGDVYDVQVKVPLYPRFEVGERVSLSGKVSLPYVAMPHDGKKTFDYEMYLRTRLIGSEMFYPKVSMLVSEVDGTNLVTRLQHLRDYFVNTISMYVDAPSSSLASGMLFGADAMSGELTDMFRTAGISHIVVLSGFNIATLISFVLLVLMFIPLYLRVIFASVLVILFVLMVGGEASIIRATLMSFIGLFALMIGRGYVARQALLLSLIAIVFYEPIHLLHDVSLHLSFLATAGIVYMGDGIKKMLHKIRSRTYQEIITTTLAAYVATLPYVMYTFGTVSLYALITNLIVLPLVPIMMLVTFLVVLFAPLSHVVALIIGYIDTLFGDFIIFVARTVEDLPFASLSVSFSFTGMCILYALLALGYSYLIHRYEKKKRDETSLTKNDEILSEIISY